MFSDGIMCKTGEVMEYRLDGKNGEKSHFYRDEIEEIIKEENIDRNRFAEFSKFQYDNIIKKFYYAFSDYNHLASAHVTLTRKGLHIRNNISCFSIVGIYLAGNWAEYLKAIKAAMPLNADEKLFLILSEGWVYEGYMDGIFKVLNKTDVWSEDFFLISRKYDWFIAHDWIDWCAFMYQK